MALSALWAKHCEGLYDVQVFANKDRFQKSDWTERPLPAAMLKYAAHDAYFLVLIAHRQISSIMQRSVAPNSLDQDTSSQLIPPDQQTTVMEVDNGDLQIWFDNF